jgi:hypothetical protein
MTTNTKTEEFIKKAKDIHKDEKGEAIYDYSKVEYIKAIEKVIIVCKIHGEFPQTPNNHLRGKGCKKCAIIKTANNQRSTTEEFINRSKGVHKNKEGEAIYDYSKVEYFNCDTNVLIICKIHGEFMQDPANHLSGKGCRECGIDKMKFLQRSTTEEFIDKAKEVHKDIEGKAIYDYSKVQYINNSTKVIIICKIHGEFNQTPSKHLSGQGCKKCGINKRANSQRSTSEEFISKSKEIHKNEEGNAIYDYSKVDYINNNTKISIICKIHGEFPQTPGSHLQGSGCPKCLERNLTTEEWIEKFKEIHKNEEEELIYDYSKVYYINNSTKVIIICKTHGEFPQTPSSHLIGSGCPKCLGRNLTTEEWIEKAKQIHKNEEGESIYDYSKVQYIKSNEKIIIICKTHGEFPQTPNSHLNGNGCPKCANNVTYTTEEFIKIAKEKHGDKYDYSKIEYVNVKTKITIICKTHGEFKQTPHSHLCGQGCPKCINKTEGKVFNFLLEILDEDDIEYQYSPDWAINKNGNKIRYDFYIPSINAILEIDGEQHFEEDHKWYDDQHTKDTEKTRLANENGIYVIRFVQEEIWDDSIDWKEMIIEMLEEEITENRYISLEESKYDMHIEMLN